MSSGRLDAKGELIGLGDLVLIYFKHSDRFDSGRITTMDDNRITAQIPVFDEGVLITYMHKHIWLKAHMIHRVRCLMKIDQATHDKIQATYG